MRYLHDIRIWRPGEPEPPFDEWGDPINPPVDVDLYDGRADVQDGVSERTVTRFGFDIEANAVVFMPTVHRDTLFTIEEGDNVDTPFGAATVKGKRYMDATVAIKFTA